MIKIGSIIKSSRWPEPIEIKLIEKSGKYIRIVGVTTYSRSHIDQLIPEKEFLELTTVDLKTNFNEEAWKVFLALETIRYRFASLYDPLLAMNTSKIDPFGTRIFCHNRYG